MRGVRWGRVLLVALAGFFALATVLPSYGAEASGEAPQGQGSATLSWCAPTSNIDGTPLTDLDAFRISWGNTTSCPSGWTAGPDITACGITRPSQSCSGQRDISVYTTHFDVTDETVTTTVVTVNVVGNVGDVVSVFFAMTASDAEGNESVYSNEVEKQFRITDTIPPNPPEWIMFGQPVSFTCTTPQGHTCQLEEVTPIPLAMN